MKYKLLLLLLPLLFISNLIGSITIDKPFVDNILNTPLRGMPDIYTYSDLEKKLNDKLGYTVISYIPEIEGKKRYFTDNKKYLGEFLIQIANSYNATFDINDKKGIITFKQKFSTFVKLPNGWDLDGVMKDLRENYSHTLFKINNNRIYAYGTEKEIDTITPVFNNIEYLTNKSYSFAIRILPYNTQEHEKQFIGYKKSYGNSMDKANIDNNNIYFQKIIHLKHKDQFSFYFQNRIINIKLNMVKEALIFDNYYEIPLNKLYDLGYVIEIDHKKSNLLFEKNITKKDYIIEIVKSDL